MNGKTRATAALLGLLAAGALHAQGHPAGTAPRTWFEFQAYVPRLETTLQSDPAFSSGSGSRVDAERDLGVSSSGAGAGLGFGRRIGERWRFEADYLRLQRKGDTVLTRSLQIGDISYAAGARVETKVLFQFARIVGGMTFVQSDEAEFGFVLGGALQRLSLSVRDGSTSAFTTDWASAEAMPLLGLFFNSHVAQDWQLSGRLEGGAIGDSAFVNLAANVVWRASPNLGLGAGLRFLKGHTQTDDLDLFLVYNRRFEFQLGGPQLFVNLAF